MGIVEAKCKLRVTTALQTVCAKLADSITGGRLKFAVGESLLEAIRHYIDATERAVETALAISYGSVPVRSELSRPGRSRDDVSQLDGLSARSSATMWHEIRVGHRDCILERDAFTLPSAATALHYQRTDMTIRVMHFGLGPIGCAVARQLLARKGFKIVGGIDIDGSKAGKDVGDIIGIERTLRARVWADASEALRKTDADVVVLCTTSKFKDVAPQIKSVLGAGIPIVSTTEEMAYPTTRNRVLAREIDALAKRAKVAVLATGVNPGFVMDTLPIMLTAPCERVDAIYVDRIQDAGSRRLPFQKKIGAGLTVKEFKQKVTDGSVRHVGLEESIQMIADALGWKVSKITDQISPKVAQTPIKSKDIAVEAGQVCGLIQDGVGYVDGRPVITLHMEAYLGAPESYDAVRIEGHPALNMRILGGTPGDVATASMVVNSIPKVLTAMPGYRTMRDMPIPSFYRGKC